MEFIRVIDQIADEYEGYSFVPLKVLQPSREPFKALFLQPSGQLTFSNNSIGHHNEADALVEYQGVIDLATESIVDFLLTPEYSTPWSIIDLIESGQYQPEHGALWALGCESITLEAIEAFKSKAKSNGHLVMLGDYDNDRPDKSFFCPLVYIFWLKDTNENLKLCFLVQFKITPSVAPVEEENMITGKCVYKFGDGNNELDLFSLICADVFGFSDQSVRDNHRDSYIFHIQLNEKPWEDSFSRYRNTLFSVGTNNNIELTCLNWANEITWVDYKDETKRKAWNYSPNSAFYVPSRRLQKLDDDHIDSLHKKGLYFNKPHPHWDGFYFSAEPHLIILNKKPIRFDGDQVLNSIPKTDFVNRYSYINNKWEEDHTADDGFISLVDEFKPGETDETFENFKSNVIEVHDSSPLSVERSFELLEGPTYSKSDWHSRLKLEALKMANKESPQRVTVNQEKSDVRRGITFKKKRLGTVIQAANFIKIDDFKWPVPLKDLQGGITFNWDFEDPHKNVSPSNGDDKKATVVYLNNSTPNEPQNMYDKLLSFIDEHLRATVTDINQLQKKLTLERDRLCVVYLENHKHRFKHYSDGKTSYTKPGAQSSTSILKEDEE